MQPVPATPDRYRLPQTQTIELLESASVDGEIYDKAKQIFLVNKGTLSTKELQKSLNITYDQSVIILNFLKKDIRPEALLALRFK